MLYLKPCRRCGELPEVTFIKGKDYGYPLEDKAQCRCYKCGNRARPAFGWHGDKQSIINMAAGFWNEEQRKRRNSKMFSGEITGTGRVFRNERETADGTKFYTYTIGFGSKRKDGGYDNASMDVRFMKDDMPQTWIQAPNATYAEIEIEHAFLTFRQYENNGHKITRWLVQVVKWSNK